MVLLEIDATSLAIFEFERNAPRSIDVNRIASWFEAVQRVKIEARNVHFLSPDSDIKTVEPGKDALMHFCVDFRTLALGPQLRKGLAFEGSDHIANVSN